MIEQWLPPEAPRPYVEGLDDEIWNDDTWIMEPKYDGWRVIVISDGLSATLYTRHGRELDLECMTNLPLGVYDGELVVREKSTNYKVHSAIHRNPKRLKIILFDILALYTGGGDLTDLRNIPFEQRRIILEEVCKLIRHSTIPIEPINWLPKCIKALENVMRHGCEGVVFKRKDSLYGEGSWVKLKYVPEITNRPPSPLWKGKSCLTVVK